MAVKIIKDRLKELRASVQFSQTKIEKMFGTAQSSIFKYESGVSTVPAEIMLKYADYGRRFKRNTKIAKIALKEYPGGLAERELL